MKKNKVVSTGRYLNKGELQIVQHVSLFYC